jgi:hypothetical protein
MFHDMLVREHKSAQRDMNMTELPRKAAVTMKVNENEKEFIRKRAENTGLSESSLVYLFLLVHGFFLAQNEHKSAQYEQVQEVR